MLCIVLVVAAVELSAVSTLKLSAFNIQIFGVSKFRKTEVVRILSKVSEVGLASS